MQHNTLGVTESTNQNMKSKEQTCSCFQNWKSHWNIKIFHSMPKLNEKDSIEHLRKCATLDIDYVDK